MLKDAQAKIRGFIKEDGRKIQKKNRIRDKFKQKGLVIRISGNLEVKRRKQKKQ